MQKLPQEVAIRVRDVHKDFHLPHNKDDSIKHKIITAFQPKDKGVDVHHALKGINFDIKKGEFFGIVGRNGSGKSTLLKIISKIYQPTSGEADYRGKLVAFIELGVGFNPQLTGRENVYLNGAMLGFSRKEIDIMYDEIVSFAELDEFMRLKLKNYSSGMKVRLAFSVAIRAKADILVLDEVLAVGDADFQRKCHDYFKNLKEEHKTIVLVSHSMGLIKEYCDRAILIEDGVIAHDGSAEEVAEEYLQLFGAKKKEEPHKVETQKAAFQDVNIIDVNSGKHSNKALTPDSEIQFRFALNVQQPIENYVFAFSVRDKKGNVIMATNTKVLGIEVHRLSDGEHEMIFSVQNIFTNGDYLVYATLFNNDMTEIYCRTAGLTQFCYQGRDKSISVAIAHPGVNLVNQG